ncbi:CDC27 family protein [Armatimonas sp.]|uniref:CDC27 family protein n=1 Tax=Armatimonas sp. TaxID=1872638 RepID=UPI00286C3308|nr:CDC27 family protein [Armatimonas sp.]
MQATAETRQRMLLAGVGLLTPMVLLAAFGLFDRYTTHTPRDQFGSRFASDSPTPEMLARIRQVHQELVGYAKQANWQKVAQRAADTCGPSCSPSIVSLQAEAYWHLGKRELAAKLWSPRYDSATPAGQADILALQGNFKSYTTFTQTLLSAPDAESDGNPNDRAWALILLPNALKDYKPAVILSERGVQLAPQMPPEGRANALNTLGVALYRAGRFHEAIATLEESEALLKEPMNTVFLALAHHKLGQQGKARALADLYYNFLQASLGDDSRNRPEYLLFEKELRVVLPPLQKATTS